MNEHNAVMKTTPLIYVYFYYLHGYLYEVI